jgi:CheY-like chemotaxis protein
MSLTAPATINSARVMVVDDEESIRYTVHELLSLEGIETVLAASAVECLEYLRKGFRGVILMDVMMPEMNGWDTIREIQKYGLIEGNIISMLTAIDVPDEQMEGLQEIVVDYITKPFESVELISSVRKYIGYLEQVKVGN